MPTTRASVCVSECASEGVSVRASRARVLREVERQWRAGRVTQRERAAFKDRALQSWSSEGVREWGRGSGELERELHVLLVEVKMCEDSPEVSE
jgi:hypothetical protein